MDSSTRASYKKVLRKVPQLCMEAAKERPYQGKTRDFGHDLWNSKALLKSFHKKLQKQLEQRIGKDAVEIMVDSFNKKIKDWISMPGSLSKPKKVVVDIEPIIIDPSPVREWATIDVPPYWGNKEVVEISSDEENTSVTNKHQSEFLGRSDLQTVNGWYILLKSAFLPAKLCSWREFKSLGFGIY